MKNLFTLVGILLIVTGLGLTTYFFRTRLNKKPAGLEINTSPAASVYLNDKNVGTTPYSDKNLPPGEYTVRLVPDPLAGRSLPPWESRLELSPLVTTVINRTFAESETDSSGSLLQLIKEPGGRTYLSVISDPDTVSLDLDGLPNGFTPATKLAVTPGSHTLSFSSPGYKPQELTVNTVKGYNLIVSAKLAVDQLVLTPPPVSSPSASPAVASASAVPSPPAVSQISKPYVLIKETGTGWLRVRQEPSGTAEELGKANVGEKLKYLGESTETGWHKVSFENLPGWVSGKYVDLVK